jgi:hypothetical protein
MEILSMPDILTMSMYESFNLRDYNEDQIIQILTFLDESSNKNSISSLDCFCKKCGKLTTFKSRNSSKEILEAVYLKKKSCDWYDRANSDWNFHIGPFLEFLDEIEFFTRSFYCPREPKDKTHDIIIVFRVTEGKVTKIGQFPQLADLENSHLKKYNELDKEIFKELNRATGLSSHAIGIGAFVYLRRIIEKHILYPELDKLIQQEVITSEQVFSSDFKGKVLLAKDNLPSILVENPRIYSILSKGIHTLSERECVEMFQPVLLAIELILDERLEQKEREKKIQKMKADLNRISK